MNFSILSINDNGYLRGLPFYKLAVKADSCEVDRQLLDNRVGNVGLSALALMTVCIIGAAFIFPAVILILPVIPFFMVIAFAVDEFIAGKAADVKAVNEYLNMPHPSSSATFRIRHNLRAAKLLVNNKGDLNKMNEEGKRLIDYNPNLKVFKLLIDNDVDIKVRGRFGYSYFQKIAEDKDLDFLDYVLKSKRVNSKDFEPNEQVRIWTNLSNVKAASLLKKYGFDINVRDDEGYTPLLRLVEDARPKILFCEKTARATNLVATLLNCGADPLLTIIKDGVEQNARQINTNPTLVDFLK